MLFDLLFLKVQFLPMKYYLIKPSKRELFYLKMGYIQMDSADKITEIPDEYVFGNQKVHIFRMNYAVYTGRCKILKRV